MDPVVGDGHETRHPLMETVRWREGRCMRCEDLLVNAPSYAVVTLVPQRTVALLCNGCWNLAMVCLAEYDGTDLVEVLPSGEMVEVQIDR